MTTAGQLKTDHHSLPGPANRHPARFDLVTRRRDSSSSAGHPCRQTKTAETPSQNAHDLGSAPDSRRLRLWTTHRVHDAQPRLHQLVVKPHRARARKGEPGKAPAIPRNPAYRVRHSWSDPPEKPGPNCRLPAVHRTICPVPVARPFTLAAGAKCHRGLASAADMKQRAGGANGFGWVAVCRAARPIARSGSTRRCPSPDVHLDGRRRVRQDRWQVGQIPQLEAHIAGMTGCGRPNVGAADFLHRSKQQSAAMAAR
jgi:hypothetical protein